MKFVLIFIMSILVIVTHQYFPDHQPREIPWLSPYSPHHPIYKYQHPIIIYYPKSRITPEIYSSQDVHWGNPQDYEENPPSSHFSNFVDVQSRGKIIQTDKLNPRFFFGTSGTITNPFLKTATFTVSSTLTLSSVVKCIVPGDFANAAAQVRPCRRKREFLQGPETFENEQFDDVISPTQPQLMMSTTLPSFDVSQENHQLPTDPQQKIINPDIISSKENVLAQSIGAAATNTSGDNMKMKRFLFFHNSNAYVVSKTVTSYSFTSQTSTITVDVAIPIGLNCLPAGFVVC